MHNHFFNENNNEQFNIIVTYHNLDLENVKYEKNYFNLILDGEPNDVNVSEYDLMITTKKDLARKNNQIFVPVFIMSFIQGKKLFYPEMLLKKEFSLKLRILYQLSPFLLNLLKMRRRNIVSLLVE